MKTKAALALCCTLLFWSLPCWAVWYGAPVPEMKKGGYAAGVAVTDFKRDLRGNSGGPRSNDYSRETFYGDYALSDGSALRGELSTVNLGDYRGTEFAVGYRRRFGKEQRIGEAELLLRKSFFGSVRSATLSDGGKDADFLQIDLGTGAVVLLNEAWSVHFGGVLSLLDGTADGRDFEGDSSIGLFVGGKFKLDGQMQFGAELHRLTESGLGQFFRYLF